MKTSLDISNQDYSNFQIFGIGKPSKKQIEKRLKKHPEFGITGCVKPSMSKAIHGNLLTAGMGSFAINEKYRKDLKAYKKCLEDSKNRIQAETVSSRESQAQSEEIKKKLADANAELENMKSSTSTSTESEDDKIMGMPKGLVIGGSVVIALGIGFLIYKVVNK